MKQFFCTLIIVFVGSFSFAQTIPEPQPQYTIVVYNTAPCAQFSRTCVEKIKNISISEAQSSSVNFCRDRFQNIPTILNSSAECSHFLIEDVKSLVPQPPEPPNQPNKVTCRALVDFICE